MTVVSINMPHSSRNRITRNSSSVLLAVMETSALAIVVVNVAGQRQRLDPYIGRFLDKLNMDSQQVVGDEVRIRMSPDGHFWARARINGLDRRLLIDSWPR